MECSQTEQFEGYIIMPEQSCQPFVFKEKESGKKRASDNWLIVEFMLYLW